MRNVSGFPSKFVKRVYDIKGSKYDRQVINFRKGSVIVDKADLQGKVMKDLDFEKIEKKLYLPEDLKQEFFDQVLSDS